MDKQTLSNYGWIVITVLVLAVMIALATPFGQYVKDAIVNTTQAFSKTSNKALDQVLDGMGVAPTPEQLQNRYEFEYYSSLTTALSDVKNGTIGDNADCNKDTATVGIYTTDDGVQTVILLKDVSLSSGLAVESPITLNLGGKTLEFALSDSAKVGLDIASEVVLDGRLEGSSIIGNTTGTEARLIQSRPDKKLTIKDGTYSLSTTSATGEVSCIAGGGNFVLSNVTAKTTAVNAMAIALNVTSSATATITDSTFETYSETNRTYSISNSNNVEISNSKMISNTVDGGASGFITKEQCNSKLSNCQIAVNATGTGVTNAVSSYGFTKIDNCTVNTTTLDGMAYGLFANDGSEMIVSNSNVMAKSENSTAYGVYSTCVTTTSSTTLSNSDIIGQTYGIANGGEMHINNCYVYGTYCGVITKNTIYIDGGLYEGHIIGGIYFCGNNQTYYVKNATITQAELKYGFTPSGSERTYSGFYVGGSEGNDNITVYMDNCNIYGAKKAFCMRGTEEKNNTVYISNSKLDVNAVRIDNNTMKLYVGEGMDISETLFYSNDNVDIDGTVVKTDENYSY